MCEFCEDCEFPRCICNLDINYWTAFSIYSGEVKHTTKIKIKNEVLKLAEQDLNKEQLEYFNSEINL